MYQTVSESYTVVKYLWLTETEYALNFQQDLKEALVQIQMYSKLEELLLKKKILSNGDSPEHHGVKVWVSLDIIIFISY